jgi:hypothetical protein
LLTRERKGLQVGLIYKFGCRLFLLIMSPFTSLDIILNYQTIGILYEKKKFHS